jgi:hypothetical protein
MKRGLLIQLVPFDLLRVLPLGVTILEVKVYGFVVVSWTWYPYLNMGQLRLLFSLAWFTIRLSCLALCT